MTYVPDTPEGFCCTEVEPIKDGIPILHELKL